jgi:hypothetical protein
LEKLAYDSALRALDKQEHLVEELRARGAVILAASSLAVSFLGRRGFAGPGPEGLALVVLVCFVASVGAAVFVLMPKKSLRFSIPASDVIAYLFDFRDAPGELFRRAADLLDRLWEQNDATIHRVGRALFIAATALCLEVACLAALLGGTLV